MSSNRIADKIKLKTIDDLLIPEDKEIETKDDKYKIYEIPLVELVPFEHHTFEVEYDDELQELVNNIKQLGEIIHPGVVRKKGDKFEIISGHRRNFALKLAGFQTMPVRIVEASDEQALFMMAQANFGQRKSIKHSEKARTYAALHNIKKESGARDEESYINRIAEMVHDDAKKIQRYIRMASLGKEIFKLIDKGILGFIPAVEIADLGEDEQSWLVDLVNDGAKLTKDKAKVVKESFKNGILTKELLKGILSDSNTDKSKSVIKRTEIEQYFAEDTSDEDMKQIIIDLLEKWARGDIK